MFRLEDLFRPNSRSVNLSQDTSGLEGSHPDPQDFEDRLVEATVARIARLLCEHDE